MKEDNLDGFLCENEKENLVVKEELSTIEILLYLKISCYLMIIHPLIHNNLQYSSFIYPYKLESSNYFEI